MRVYNNNLIKKLKDTAKVSTQDQYFKEKINGF